MIDKHTLAVYAMCAIVITLYAIRDSHTHWLADFFGLCLALTAPRQSMAVGAVVIAAIIRHSSIAYGLADYIPDWLLPIVLPGARYMSTPYIEAAPLEQAYKERISEDDQDEETEETAQRVAENHTEIIVSAQVQLAAKAVLSGALGITEATRLASGAQSGRRYSRWSRLIKSEIARVEKHYADLDQNRNQIAPKP